MKAKVISFCLLMATVLFVAIFFSSCGGSISGNKIKEKEAAQAAQKAAQDSIAAHKPTFFQVAQQIPLYAGNSFITCGESDAEMLPTSTYESEDVKSTTAAVNDLVKVLERHGAYLRCDVARNGIQTNAMKTFITGIDGGPYYVTVKKLDGKIILVEIDVVDTNYTSTTGSMPLTMSMLAFDSNGDGFLNPILGDDMANWPVRYQSSSQFYDQTEYQHRIANANYLQLITHIAARIRYTDR